MPNLTIPGAGGAIPAEGQHTVNRRMLLGCGIASSVVAIGATIAAASAAQSGADAELLELAAEIAEADRAFEVAIDRKRDAEIAFNSAAPRRPVALAPGFPDVSDEEWFKLFLQKTAWKKGAGPFPEAIAYDAALAVWEQDCERLREECGVAVADAEEEEASDQVGTIRDCIAGTRATTLAGIIFKAKYAAAHYSGEYEQDVMVSIVDDLLALPIGSTAEAPARLLEAYSVAKGEMRNG